MAARDHGGAQREARRPQEKRHDAPSLVSASVSVERRSHPIRSMMMTPRSALSSGRLGRPRARAVDRELELRLLVARPLLLFPSGGSAR